MRRHKNWLLISVVVGIVSVAFFITLWMSKVTIVASPVALTEQGWVATFSETLDSNAVTEGAVYVTDQQGEKVEAKMMLTNNGRSLQVSKLMPGKYTLQVGKSAFQHNFWKWFTKESYSFVIYDQLQPVSSMKELEAYFKAAWSTMDTRHSDRKEMNIKEDKGSGEQSAGARDDSYSETNNQVEGIDEDDIVKTDGSFIYSITDQEVVISDVRDPKQLAVASRIQFDQFANPSKLFIHDKTLIIIGDRYELNNYQMGDQKTSKMMPQNGMTTVQFYSIEDPKKPKFIREIGMEGSLNGARKTDGRLYLVTNMRPDFWLLREGKEVELRPFMYDTKDEKKITALAYSDLSILPGTLEPNYSIVTTVDLTNLENSTVSTKGYLGSSEQLYMSKDNLYLTATKFDSLPQGSEQQKIAILPTKSLGTDIFKFSLKGDTTEFVASTMVKGSLLNQFSMDEYKGYFRVVTTEGFASDEKTPSENHLFILNDGLQPVGEVSGLAKGERIYSARFMGDKAYMVTFKQTDPLFVIDVANPSKPQVLGELKIPGFSNYLHPLDENHLIGFGYDTKSVMEKGAKEPRIITMGMKISLFDVRDVNNPKEKDHRIIGGRGTHSPLQYDHKALFQHKKLHYYGFPIIIYEGTDAMSEVNYKGQGALVYEITPEKGIVLKGDLVKPNTTNEQYEDWEQAVERVLYVKDSLFTISRTRMTSYSLENFEPLSSLEIAR